MEVEDDGDADFIVQPQQVADCEQGAAVVVLHGEAPLHARAQLPPRAAASTPPREPRACGEMRCLNILFD